MVLPYINMSLPQVYNIPNPESPSLLPPCTIPLGRPSAKAPSIQYHALNLDWWFISYMILYKFQCYSLKLPHLLPFPEPKRLFYTSVSLLLFHIQGYSYRVSKFHVYVLAYCQLVYCQKPTVSWLSFYTEASRSNFAWIKVLNIKNVCKEGW